MKILTTPERRRLAEKAGVNDAYLYQCLTGRRDMGPVEARRLETVLDGAIMRWDVCQHTWHLIWPELIDAEGAPAPERRQRERRDVSARAA